MSDKTELDAELEKVLFKLRTTRQVEHNDNQWTTKFVYTLQEAKAALKNLIAEERRKAVERHISPHLRICQQKNGLPYCKNCGLTALQKESE